MTRKSAPEAPALPDVQEVDPLAALDAPEEINPASTIEVSDKVKDFVKRGHELWTEKPRKWWAYKLGSETRVKDVRRQAKAYAQTLGWTFRVKNVADKTLLVCRVTDAPPVRDNAPETEQEGSAT